MPDLNDAQAEYLGKQRIDPVDARNKKQGFEISSPRAVGALSLRNYSTLSRPGWADDHPSNKQRHFISSLRSFLVSGPGTLSAAAGGAAILFPKGKNSNCSQYFETIRLTSAGDAVYQSWHRFERSSRSAGSFVRNRACIRVG